MTRITPRLRGRAAVAQRKRRMERHHGLCWRCLGVERWTGQGLGKVTAAKIVNHIVPLIHGGSDDDDNTENLCVPCDKFVTAQQFGFKQKHQIGADGWPVR